MDQNIEKIYNNLNLVNKKSNNLSSKYNLLLSS